MSADDAALDRFATPLYTVAEAARHLGVPATTFARWARGHEVSAGGRRVKEAPPLLTSVRGPDGRGAWIPFVGLAEGYALAAIRAAGVPLQRVRPAVLRLGTELGVAHPLASSRLATDGVEVLFELVDRPEAAGSAGRELVVVRTGQRVLHEAVASWLSRLEHGRDGYALVVPLVGVGRARLVADARRAGGRPVLEEGGAPLAVVVAALRGGRSPSVVADEHGIPLGQADDLARALLGT